MTVDISGKIFLHFLGKTSFFLILMLSVIRGASAESFAALNGYWQCQEEVVRSSLEFQSESKLIFSGQQAVYQLLANILGI